MKPMSKEVRANPDSHCLPEILAEQVVVEVVYINFDGQKKSGVIEVNRAVADDVRGFFALALKLKFPIEKVVRASDEPFLWDDDKMMAANATSGFNYREIAGVDELSNHAFGRAIDVNTRLNPYIRLVDGQKITLPIGAMWDPTLPGTLTPEHPLVGIKRSRGREWGGDWTYETRAAIDYQHFEKPTRRGSL
jgi:hypothetical protein